MRLICPACGSQLSLDALLTDAEARDFAALCLRVPPPLGPGLLRYLALFRPARTHCLSWKRAARLLGELLADIDAGQITRNRQAHRVPIAAWEVALDEIVERRDRLRLPLDDGHGYLYECLITAAARLAADAVRAAEQAVTLHPSHRPAASFPVGEVPGARVPEPSTAEILAEHERLRTGAAVTDAHGQPATAAELRQRWRRRGGQGTGAANPLRQLGALLAGAGVAPPPPEDTPDAS